MFCAASALIQTVFGVCYMITIVEMWLNSSIISCYSNSNNSYRNDVLLYRTYRGAGKINIFTAPFVCIGPINGEFRVKPSSSIYIFARQDLVL